MLDVLRLDRARRAALVALVATPLIAAAPAFAADGAYSGDGKPEAAVGIEGEAALGVVAAGNEAGAGEAAIIATSAYEQAPQGPSMADSVAVGGGTDKEPSPDPIVQPQGDVAAASDSAGVSEGPGAEGVGAGGSGAETPSSVEDPGTGELEGETSEMEEAGAGESGAEALGSEEPAAEEPATEYPEARGLEEGSSETVGVEAEGPEAEEPAARDSEAEAPESVEAPRTDATKASAPASASAPVVHTVRWALPDTDPEGRRIVETVSLTPEEGWLVEKPERPKPPEEPVVPPTRREPKMAAVISAEPHSSRGESVMLVRRFREAKDMPDKHAVSEARGDLEVKASKARAANQKLDEAVARMDSLAREKQSLVDDAMSVLCGMRERASERQESAYWAWVDEAPNGEEEYRNASQVAELLDDIELQEVFAQSTVLDGYLRDGDLSAYWSELSLLRDYAIRFNSIDLAQAYADALDAYDAALSSWNAYAESFDAYYDLVIGPDNWSPENFRGGLVLVVESEPIVSHASAEAPAAHIASAVPETEAAASKPIPRMGGDGGKEAGAGALGLLGALLAAIGLRRRSRC